MAELIFGNILFLILIGITAIFTVALAILSKKFNWMEGVIQWVLLALLIVIIVAIGYSKYRVVNHEFWNGYVESVTKKEAWTEDTSYWETDEDGNSHYVSESTRHSEQRYAETTIGSHNLSSNEFTKYEREFGSVFEDLFHFDQISHGDGNAYHVYPTKTIPVSMVYSYNNWVKASEQTIYKEKGLEEDRDYLLEQGFLFDYPTLTTGDYGQPYLYRVLHKTSYNFDWMEFALSQFCALNSAGTNFVRPEGQEAQFNLLVYIVENAPRELVPTLSFYWEGGQKNDTIIIISLDGTKIGWADSIGLTTSGEYVTQVKRLQGYDIISEQAEVVNHITSNIRDNWVRTPMETFEYLKADLVLPFWAQLLSVLICIIGNGILAFLFLKNDFDDGDDISDGGIFRKKSNWSGYRRRY